MPILQIHVAISLLAIASGIFVIAGLITDRYLNGWTAFCLLFTVLTSLTGFLLPLHGLDPPVVVAIVSLVVLAIAIVSLYSRRLQGGWRSLYIVTLMIALYLNVFVLIAQMFNKLPAFKPYENEPLFQTVQGVVLLLFVILTVVAIKKFHPNLRAKLG